MKKIIALVICITIALTACNSQGAEQSAALVQNETPAPQVTATPATPATPSPTPAATPEATPEATAPVHNSERVVLYLCNAVSGQMEAYGEEIEINADEDKAAVFERLFKKSLSEDYDPLITPNTKVNFIQTDESKSLVSIDLSQEFISEMDVGAGIESTILNCIAKTLGEFYNMDYVQITIDGKRYESGHIVRDIGDYIEVE